MNHLSEVLKILEGALKANGTMAVNYAGLLADKLDAAGERKQAALIREQIARTPRGLAVAQGRGGALSLTQLPVDSESRLETVDVSRPTISDEHQLALPDAIEKRVDEFVATVERFEELVRAGAANAARLLTYGPPGTGKTRLAHTIASRLGVPLLTVRCDTLIGSLLGQTSRNLRRVFEFSQNSPSVLFLDELDALGTARGNERDVGELQRIVIALLQNIDALPPGQVVIAATNQERALDSAIWRRFPFHIKMPLPDSGLRVVLWQAMLDTFAPHKMEWATLSRLSEGLSGAVIEQVCLDAKRDAVFSASATVDRDHLYRRLALAMATVRGEQLASSEAEIRYLRGWSPKIFSLRSLATVYDTTVRRIQAITKDANAGEFDDKWGSPEPSA